MKRLPLFQRALAGLLLGLGGVAGAIAATPAPGGDADGAVPAVFAHAASAEQLQAMLGPAGTRLRSAAVLRGPFTQRKRLHELPQPLVSNGEFLVARGLGVDWHTQKPFDASVVLTPRALIQRGADGSTKRISADEQPGLRAVGEVFDALFTLDLAKLGQTFELYGEPGEQGAWTLGLVPREAAFAKVMSRIVVSGAAQPARIALYERSGDRTEIEFGKLETQDALAEADRKRFAP